MTATLTRPTHRPTPPRRHAGRVPAPPLHRTLPPIDDVTRRELLRGAAALLVAAGCGTDRQPVAGPSPTATTRTVEHALGTTQIPVAPQQLVVLNPFAILDALVAVGVMPAGSSGDPAADYPYAAWLEGRTEGVELVGFTGEEDLEQIALLEPDLILANPWQEDTYPELSEIAPTVGVPLSYADYLEEVRSVADLVGKGAEAEALIADHQERIEDFKESLGNRVGMEVSVLRALPDGLRAGGGGYIFTLLDALDFSRPDGQQGPDQTELSLEQVEQVDADVIFVYSAANAADEEANAAARVALLDSPLWQQLDAVQAGQAHVVDSSLWAGGGLLWAEAMLDDLSRYLLDGESP